MRDGKGPLKRVSPATPAIALILLFILPAPAFAATWTGRTVPAVGQAPLFGISCPDTSLCVAVGAGNTIASSSDPAGGENDWSAVNPGGIGPPNQNEIKGVSCPSPQLCVAVDFEGLVLTSTDPTGGVGAWNVADLSPTGPSVHFYGVSCPTVSFCAAAAGGAKVLTSTNPTGGAAAWTTTQLPGPLELRGISCPSPSFCVAVGDNGAQIRPGPVDQGEILSSTNPLGGVWQRVETRGTPGNLFGISCPSPALCVTGNALGNLFVSTSPTGPAASWPPTGGGGSVQLTASSCPSPTRCIAVDNNADVLTSTDPAGGRGAWTFTNLIPYTKIEGTILSNAMWGASCPTIAFCAISAGDGQVFTSENPFAATAAPGKAAGGAGKKKRGPRRPRTTIAHRPDPATEIGGGKLTVRFRFFATKGAPVSGFVCGIDKRPLRPCHSPRRYRVGAGRHRFRVRAKGWSGLRGPPATAAFLVCRRSSFPAQGPPCSRTSQGSAFS